MLRFLHNQIAFDMDYFWPISVFTPKIPQWQDIITLFSCTLLFLALIKLWQTRTQFKYLLIILVCITLGTNALQGFQEGFIYPITTPGGVDYWHDAQKIQSIPNFLAHYTTIQPYLLDHSRVHPPGAILFYYLNQQISQNPVVCSLIIFLIGLFGLWIFYTLLQSIIPSYLAKTIAVLFVLLPVFQIYSIASFDLILMAVILLCFWSWQQNFKRPYFLISVLSLWLISFLTYAIVWLIPLLLLDDWRRYKSIKNSFYALSIIAIIYVILKQISGFDYTESFSIAKSFEGSTGFYLLANPISYLITRLENVTEILLFLGPFTAYLLVKSIQHLKPWQNHNNISASAGIAIVFLLLFFLGGAYYTGETARAAMFIYPFLLIPIAQYVNKMKARSSDMKILLTAAFTQSLMMQLLGNYGW